MTEELPAANDDALRAQIAELRRDHADLDAAISALGAGPAADQLLVVRLKRRKLALRDQIVLLENRLTPDIIA